ncbi:molecular chaperone [Tirmania nivea]|nr:molecular chaperone [Tirmania nivea]
MSSQRLLDLLALAAAARQILAHHARLRAGQLGRYAQTTSLARPLRGHRGAPPRQRDVPVGPRSSVRQEGAPGDPAAQAQCSATATAPERGQEHPEGGRAPGMGAEKEGGQPPQELHSLPDAPRRSPPEPATAEASIPASAEPVSMGSFPPDEASHVPEPPPAIPSAELDQPPTADTPTADNPTADTPTVDIPTADIPTAEAPQLSQQPAPSPSGHVMTASRVPASRFSRMMHYTGLGLGMTLGALTEGVKRAAVGSSGAQTQTPLMLNEANVERLVKKLSRMRGAALKLGQMLSFQDSKLLPSPLHQILSRVQDSADYMPPSQLHPILVRTLGPSWESLFTSFNRTPLAAASIGQVHLATLSPHLIPPSDPRSPSHPDHTPGPYPVAVKIQYPGIKASISSDLTNLSLLLTASRLLPKGLYLDRTIANARTELAWECDYARELHGLETFRALLPPGPGQPFIVPHGIRGASGADVLTMEFMHGAPVARIPDLTQPERDFLGTSLLRLALTELAHFRFMQTDPNFSNFLFDRARRTIQLLDFGAWRAYPPAFVDTYLALLRAARARDARACANLSIQLGYLTGMEARGMADAHVQSVFILAEPFRCADYDFAAQTVTDRIKALIPLMLRERLTPPPEETYSLHRKLSGAFLLCARLGSRVDCERIFGEVVGF